MPTTNYIWDSENDSYLMETDESNVSQTVYTNEPVQFGSLVSQRRGSDMTYFHFDALNSTREATITDQTTTDAYLYDAWGSVVAHAGTTVFPFTYIGGLGYHRDEETHSYNVRHRLYQSILGRWMSCDPLLVIAPTRYRYSGNNPALYIDPSGLFCDDDKICCCCVDKLDFNLVRDLKPGDNVTKCFGKPLKIGPNSYGNEFLLSLKFQAVLADRAQTCHLRYFEKSNQDVGMILKKCQPPIDTVAKHPDLPSLEQFNKDLNEAKCPDPGKTAFFYDCPLTPLKSKDDDRLLCIEAKVESPCSKCPKKEVVIYIKQLCEFNNGKPKCTVSAGPKPQCTEAEWEKYCPKKKDNDPRKQTSKCQKVRIVVR